MTHFADSVDACVDEFRETIQVLWIDQNSAEYHDTTDGPVLALFADFQEDVAACSLEMQMLRRIIASAEAGNLQTHVGTPGLHAGVQNLRRFEASAIGLRISTEKLLPVEGSDERGEQRVLYSRLSDKIAKLGQLARLIRDQLDLYFQEIASLEAVDAVRNAVGTMSADVLEIAMHMKHTTIKARQTQTAEIQGMCEYITKLEKKGHSDEALLSKLQNENAILHNTIQTHRCVCSHTTKIRKFTILDQDNIQESQVLCGHPVLPAAQ